MSQENTQNNTPQENLIDETLQLDGKLKEEEFDHYDDTELQLEDTSDYKYTEIDCLNEDPEILGQKYALLSFVSPEGIMNCKVRGLMVRGVYATQEEANTACEKLKRIDKYHDIFVGPVGKWLPWNPTSKQVEKVKYRNKKLDKIMKKIHDSDNKSLNELVGRRKEMLDKERTSHKNRIRESIKDSVDGLVDTSEEKVTGEQPKTKKSMRDPEAIKQRLKKTLEKRAKNIQPSRPSQLKPKGEIKRAELIEQKEQLKTESDRISEKNENITKLEQTSSALEEKLEKLKKMRQMYEQRNK